MTFDQSDEDHHHHPYHHHPFPTTAPEQLPSAVLDEVTTGWHDPPILMPERTVTMGGLSPPAVTVPSTSTSVPQPPLDPSKPTHPEWGVMKDQDFHPLTLKHQRDLENLYQSGSTIKDFYFWQANLGGYCMADMVQMLVYSSEGWYVLVRRVVEGAPHPGRRTKKRGMG